MAGVVAPSLLDQAIAAAGGSDQSYVAVTNLAHVNRVAADVDAPITIEQFAAGALRPAAGVRRTRVLYDVETNVPEFGQMRGIVPILARNAVSELPLAIRPGAALPAETRMGLVIVNNEDGTLTTMKVYYFEGSDSPTLRQLNGVVRGVGYVPVAKAGPWGLKKGLQHLMDRILGFHVDRFSLVPRSAGRRQDSGWTVDRTARREGVEFVNQNCPEENDKNQQWLWIQESIEADSGTPIAGWPECKVQRLADNKSKGAHSAAMPEHFFPLTTCDLHPLWQELLPLFYPLLPEYGLLLLGLPSSGKTPAFITTEC